MVPGPAHTAESTEVTHTVRRSNDVEMLSLLRRRIRFRAWHRGTSEADLLLGGFVDGCIDGLATHELHVLDRLLETDDPIIDDWIRERQVVPEEFNNDVLQALKRFCLAPMFRGESHDKRPHGD